MKRRRRRDWRGANRVVAALLFPVALLTATAAGVTSSTAYERAADANVEERSTRLHYEVWRIGRAQLRESNLGALDALGHDQGATLTEARQARVQARRAAVVELEELAAGDDEVADVAARLVELLADQSLDAAGGVALHRVWDTLYDLQVSAAQQTFGDARASALGALAEVALVPWFVVSDALDLEYVRTSPVVPIEAREYFSRSEAYIFSGEAGWLDDDPDDPFSGTWIPREQVRAQLPVAEEALDAAFGTAPARVTVALDRWVTAVRREVAVVPPPVSITEAMESADALVGQLAPTVEAEFVAARRSAQDTAASARVRGISLRVGAILPLLLGAIALFISRRHRRRSMDDLTLAAESDGLTGLANRRAIQRRVSPRLLDPDRAAHVVLQIDLDRFKAVNDAYGHRVGDELLMAFAGRITGVLDRLYPDRPGAREFARVGGDEFLIVLHDSTDPRGEAGALMAALMAAFAAPVACGPIRIPVELSGGVAVATGPSDLDHVLLEADIALYQAKDRERISFVVFDDPILRDIVRDFPGRVAAGAVRADLQPQVDLLTGEVRGFEALARWSVDGQEAVPAALWIKAVEQLGGTDLLFQAVTRSVGDAMRILGPTFAGRFWLNLSPLQLGERESAERLLDHLEVAGLPPTRVGVEVLETAVLSDLSLAAQNLDRLRAAGMAVALDDFGSGFTPLGHLTALPVDLLKVDRTVVAGIDRRPRQAALVEAMVTIAERLGLDLVAEGIETPAERNRLVDLGVRVGQGYLLGHPAPAGSLVPDEPSREWVINGA